MANVFTRFLNNLNLTEDDDDYDDDENYNEDDSVGRRNDYPEADEEEETPKRSRLSRRREETYDEEEEYEQPKPAKQPKKNYGKVVHMKSISGGAANMELRVIRPKVYDDSREISDTLSSGMPVVLNLEGLNADLAQRILDFTSGAVYAMNGNLQKVTSYIFVITPNNVIISGNFDEMLDGSVDLSGSTKYVFRD